MKDFMCRQLVCPEDRVKQVAVFLGKFAWEETQSCLALWVLGAQAIRQVPDCCD